MATSNKLFTIYGARMSKDGTRVNVSLINTEGDETEWAMCSIAKKGKGKTKVKVEDKYVFVAIPLLKETTKKKVEEVEEIEEIEYPF